MINHPQEIKNKYLDLIITSDEIGYALFEEAVF